MPEFNVIDFQAYMNRNLTLRIAVQDQSQQWIQPPFTTGYFAIAPQALAPALQGSVTKLFERDTSGVNVRFTNLAAGPEWFLDCDILPADTMLLTPGVYYYEASLLLVNGKFPLTRGLFQLNPTIT